MKTRRARNAKPRWGLLIGLLSFFIGTPFLCYSIATLDGPDWTYALVIPGIYWLALPAHVFGPRLFERVQYGYNPVGIAGWLAALLFYAAIAVLCWIAIRTILASRRTSNI